MSGFPAACPGSGGSGLAGGRGYIGYIASFVPRRMSQALTG